LKEFIASYYSPVYSAVSRLSGQHCQTELDTLTREILDDLWGRKAQLEAQTGKGVFIYKVVLAHVLAHLKANGQEAIISTLQKILLIAPANYAQLAPAIPDPDNENPLPAQDRQGDVGIW